MRALAFVAPLYAVACVVPEGGLLRSRRYRDVGVYGDYADALLDGRLPYRDVFVEYPPGAFLVFTPPAFLPDSWYLHAFKLLMAVVGLATLLVAAIVLVRLGASNRRLYGALVALALAPLAVGPVFLNTYDAWPTLLVVGAVAALLHGRASLAFGLVGIAVASKLYPLALVPLFAVWLRRRGDPVLRPLATLAAATLLVATPFALVGSDGLVDSFEAQAGRGLQIESLGASILLAGHRVGVYEAQVVRGSTEALSRDLGGALPDGLATLTTLAQLVAVGGALLLFLRGRAESERLVAAAAATIAGFLAFSRFVSPQYLLWAVPLVPLVAGRSGVAATAILGTALALGQLWFFHYRDVFELDGIVWLVVVRNLLLVALYGVLVAALLKTKIPSSTKTDLHDGARNSRASGTAVVEADDRRSR